MKILKFFEIWPNHIFFSNPNKATVEVSDLGDIRTLRIEPKHGISGIYAR